MLPDVPLYMGSSVFEQAAADLREEKTRKVLLVADANTRQACGQMLEAALRAAAVPFTSLVLEGEPRVSANETSIARVLTALEGQKAVLAAVGSGTLTDIVRFVAFQTRLPFLSIPSALSVDAYASYTAAISIAAVKYSIPAKTARAVYAHLPTLAAAPPAMTAAGFSDMLAKFTALADWRLAHLLNDDEYDPAVAQRAGQAALACAQAAAQIGARTPEGIQILLEALAASGNCMVAVKTSRPAAGSEHSLAHFWEMKHEQNGRPESLHGQKTGVASVITARLYERLRTLSRAEAAARLARFHLDPQAEQAAIHTAYGPIAAQICANRASFLGSTGSRTEAIGRRLLEHWDQVIELAAAVPRAQELLELLAAAGACTLPAEIHVTPEEVAQAVRVGMYTRDRFTILELSHMLGLAEG